MKRICAAVLVCGLYLVVTGSALASETKAPKPIVVNDEVTVKATVEAIDKTNRLVTLKGPKGNVMTLPVDESVDRFDSVKVGDTVTAHYYESVAYEIRKPGAPAAPDSVTTGAASLEGEKPGGAVAGMTVTTVTVEGIDLAIPAVTVRTSDGSMLDFRVRHKKHLKDLKVGDQVIVTQTEALMIAVDATK